uniref:Uncharacterized protein n=1 Tax=Nonomuraea gerenzanensis TaxID=93944 RepID=A0A1M4DVI3_9ACTN|nr:hypothetical protein BN4615_P90 [Nonomuraea gerenzanensis]
MAGLCEPHALCARAATVMASATRRHEMTYNYGGNLDYDAEMHHYLTNSNFWN